MTDAARSNAVSLRSILSNALALVPGRGATIYTPHLLDGDPQGLWESKGLPAELLRDYQRHYGELDVWAAAAASTSPPATGMVLDTDRLLDRADLRKTEFYADYLSRYDIARCLVAIIDDGLTSEMPRIRLTIVRGHSEQPFTVAEGLRLQMITGLARSFVELASAGRTNEGLVDLQRVALDLLRMPLLIADADRLVHFANRAATAYLGSDGPLAIRHNRLRAVDAGLDAELGRELRWAWQDPSDIRFLRLGPGRPLRPSPAAVITPIAARDPGSKPAGLLVRILVPGEVPPDSARILQDLLHLTRGESDVALGLAAGLSAEEIAERRGVTVATVRTQQRRLKEKLGIARSGALAQFIRSTVATGGMRL